MTQEQKELLLKDLCARLSYGVKCDIGDNKPYTLNRIEIDNNNGHLLDFIEMKDGLDMQVYLSEVKPYLFPLSSITIEQEKELSKLGVSYGEYALHDDIRGLGIYVDEAYIFFEFCYKHHIDFLGLIEMGLANDATGLNIY